MGGKGTEGWHLATRLVRGGTKRSQFDETSEGLFLTSGYVYDSAAQAEGSFTGDNDHLVYSRYGNPTVGMFEERMKLLDGAAFAFATASGMAAVFSALMSQLRQGDRVVASRALFGACHFVIAELLPRWGIATEFVDGTDLAEWERALAEPTQVVLLETPSNPGLEIIDLKAVCDLVHKAGARVVVDNVFATPILQRPLEFGADIVAYSATKHIDGQGRVLGGMILTDDEDFYKQQLTPFVRNTGPAISPFNAWVLLKGLETLELRVHRQCDNALTVARFLEGRKGVTRVLYPGLESHPQRDLVLAQMDGRGGTVVTFEVEGGRNAAYRLLDGLELIDISNNLGDAKSIITHPYTTTHQKVGADEKARLGITEGLVRLSVGLEDVRDIEADLARVLD